MTVMPVMSQNKLLATQLYVLNNIRAYVTFVKLAALFVLHSNPKS